MFRVAYDFFMDGATFKRAMSDVGAIASIAAMTPGVPEAIATIPVPGIGFVPMALAAITFLYSARKRQLQVPTARP
jgi:hypothetical protein